METRTEVLFIETASALEALCARLEDYAWLAVDMEFHREKPIIHNFAYWSIS
jgi:hypothetical protein